MWLGLLVTVAACSPRPGLNPRLVWGGASPSIQTPAAALAGALQVGPGVRRIAWGASGDASFELVEAAAAEEPHTHALHDCTVVLLGGSGALTVGLHRYELRVGDIAHIPRGEPHCFNPSKQPTTRALVIFTPAMTERDWIPVPGVCGPELSGG